MLRTIFILLIICFVSRSQLKAVEVEKTDGAVRIENSFVSVNVDLNAGVFKAIDKRDNTVCLTACHWEINGLKSDDGYMHSVEIMEVSDHVGSGKRITVSGTKKGAHSLLFMVSVYDKHSFFVLNCGMKNTSDKAIQVKRFVPMAGIAFKGMILHDIKSLDGGSGEYVTTVKRGNKNSSHNNMLVTFGRKGERKRSLVFGGASYAEFVKHVEIKNSGEELSLEMWADDPIGKRIDPASITLFSNDGFYIDYCTDSPFLALEKYGQALKILNGVKMDTITYPGLNFWYCQQGQWGGDKFKNTSTGIIDALEKAKETGFLNYSPLAVRLEPDDYSKPNNQQGWWDDKHLQMYKSGKLEKPYDTIVKWGGAVQELGGVPFIYCQTARRSEDYCKQFPGHILFNDVSRKRSKGRINYYHGDELWSYDFTDPGFIKHMREVYANFKAGGVKAMKFDYPDTGWAYDGGLEDKYATATSAYRNIYKLAFDGLGPESDIHERLPRHGDVCLGVITTHRTEGDTDRYYPVMARKCGLRWYKNRVVVKYVNDVINPFHAFPFNRDGWRTMYTMSLLTNGRIEIGKYIEKMTDEMRYDLTRILPMYKAHRSARPVDAFAGKEYPAVFDFAINQDWHLVAFYNTKIQTDPKLAKEQWASIPREYNAKYKKAEVAWPTKRGGVRAKGGTVPLASSITVQFDDSVDDGGLGLDNSKNYYVYDFWNKRFIGKLSGGGELKQELRPGETRVMAVHAVQANPQFISTNRHIMQGYVDMVKYPVWNAADKQLSGISSVVCGETYKVIVAMNGMKPTECFADSGAISIKIIDLEVGIAELSIDSAENKNITWKLNFK